MATSSSSSKTFADDELVINYHDACIYGRDLKLLKSRTAWLNDACLHYYFSCLQQQLETKNYWLLWDPAVVSFLMHQCQDDDDDLLDLSRGYDNFRGVQRILVPINDNYVASNWQVPGKGTHWSLMLVQVKCVDYDCESNRSLCFFHFDSVPGSNQRAAQQVARKLTQLWSLVQQQQTIRDNNNNVVVQECRVPTQANGYDCGIHVLATAEALLLVEEHDDGSFRQSDMEQAVQQRMTNDPMCCCVKLRQRIARDIIDKQATERGQSN